MDTNTNLNEGWEEVADSNYWSPEKEGEFVEGIITKIDKDDFGLKVTIENQGKPMILPSHKVLQNRLQSCKAGDMIRVVFERKELPKVKGHNPTNIYKVLTKKINP
jgi:hypothetical protein